MSRFILILSFFTAAFLFTACGHAASNMGNESTAVPPTPTTPPPSLSPMPPDLPPTPAGWTLNDWALSSDGQYAATVATAPERYPGNQPTVMSVYRKQGVNWAKLVEDPHSVGFPDEQDVVKSIDPAAKKNLLSPDSSGIRRLALSPYATIIIDGSGAVTFQHIEQSRSTVEPTPTPAAFQGDENTSADTLVSVVPERRFPQAEPTLVPEVDVPSGAIPLGWKVEEAMRSPDRQYLALLMWCQFTDIGQELSIYSLRDGKLRELWREADNFIDPDEELAFQDINRDGALEVVYNTDPGVNGNAVRTTLALAIYPDGSARDVSFQLPLSIEDSYPSGPEDVDNDGIYEWWVTDHSWAYTGYSGADSPTSEFILAWNGTAYVDATERFPQAIDRGKTDPVPPPAGSTCEQRDMFLRDSISRYLDYWNSHRTADAERILNTMRDYSGIGGLAGNRDQIVDMLSTNPHPGPFAELQWACAQYLMFGGNNSKTDGLVTVEGADPPYPGTRAHAGTGLPDPQTDDSRSIVVFFGDRNCTPSSALAILYDPDAQAPIYLVNGASMVGEIEMVNGVPIENASTSGFSGQQIELKSAAIVQLTGRWDPSIGIQAGGYNILACGWAQGLRAN